MGTTPQVLYLIFTPLLGCFNAFVYFRPRYKTFNESSLDKSWIVCLDNVLNVDLDSLSAVKGSISGSRKSSGDSTDDGDLASRLFRDIGGDNMDHRDFPSPQIQGNVKSREDVAG
jgi:hypothetical protein